MNNPYHKFVADYARLLKEAESYPVGHGAIEPRGTLPADAPAVLIFVPHPDDECLIGALPLRLLREMKMKVIDVAVTLGSRKDLQTESWDQLRQACAYLGIGVLPVDERGLDKINPTTRSQSPEIWQAAVQQVAGILEQYQPRVIFAPHAKDWHSTHIGTHYLVQDALKLMDPTFCCWVCETEFWAPLSNPNLMVEVSVADLADLVAAISFHVGEVRRNPYHLRLPAWMQDNVRRGGELVGGQRADVPAFGFATLYRLKKWAKRRSTETGSKLVSCNDSLAELFG